MPFVEIQGARIFYKERGKGDPIVLVPGLGGHSLAFNPIFGILARKMRVIGFDPRGLGRSEGGEGDTGLQRQVEDLVGLLNELGIVRASFLGVSFGAIVVREMALAHRDRVEKLILCSPPMGRKDHLALVTRTIRTILENFPPEEAMMKFLELAVSERYATENRERLLDIVRWDPLDEKRKRIMEAQLEIIEKDEGKWPLEELPTLVIAGCEDKLLGPGKIIWLKSQMGQRKFVAIPHVGHNPILEAPQRVATEILVFCSPKAHLFP